MGLKHYRVDLRSLPDAELDRVYTLLDGIAWTGLIITQTPKVFECFLSESQPVKEIPGLPVGLVQEIP